MNEKCYLCQSSEKKIIHHGTRGNADIDVFRCADCGLVYLSDFPRNVEEFYEDSGMRKDDETDIGRILREAAPDDTRRFNMMKEKITNKTILDFGCGAGGYLKNASSVTREAYGVELEKCMYEYINSQGITCFASLEDAEEKLHAKVDVISLWHVLEHLEDPVEVLKHLSRFLTDNGKIIIEVPNADDALLSQYGSDAFADFTYWECHLYLFTNETLKTVVERAGLKVIYQTQVQRYPLANHLYWLTNGRPGGHKEWYFMKDEALDNAYEKILTGMGRADTLIIECGLK